MHSTSASARSAFIPAVTLLLAVSVFAWPMGARAANAQSAPPAVENADCLACHGDPAFETTGPDGQPRSLHVGEEQFTASIHGRNRCTSCHIDIVEIPHPDGFHPKPVSCAQCHRVETGIYLVSDHGLAVRGCRGGGLLQGLPRRHTLAARLARSRVPGAPDEHHEDLRQVPRKHRGDAQVPSAPGQSGRHLRAQRPRGRAAREERPERRGVHRLPRFARSAQVDEYDIEALLAERAADLRPLP